MIRDERRSARAHASSGRPWTQRRSGWVERAIAPHGGERWSRIEAIELPVLALSGSLPWLKGYLRSFGLPRIVRIDPVRVRAAFLDYPRPGERGVFGWPLDVARYSSSETSAAKPSRARTGEGWVGSNGCTGEEAPR